MTSTLLLYLGSALNPITYNIFSESFREGFWELCTNFVRFCGGGLRTEKEISDDGVIEGNVVRYKVAKQEES